MLEPFRICGINPATGEVMRLVVRAETEMDAKAQAQSCGLMHVVVTDQEPKAPVLAALPYWLHAAAAVPLW